MGIAGTAAIGLGMTVSGIIPSLIYGSNFPLEFPFMFDFFAGLFYCGLTLTLKEPERGAQDEGLEELRQRGETYDYTLTLDGALDFFKRSINLKLFFFLFLLIIVNSTLGKLFILFLNVQHGVSTGLATLMMFSIFGIQLVGQIYWGNIADRKYREKKDGRLNVMIKILGIGMCFIIPAFLIPFTFNYPAGIILFYIFAIVLATGSFFIIGTHPNTGVIVADVNFPEVRATTNSIMLLANTAATAIFIPIFTILAIYTPLNYSGTYFIFMLICFPSAFLFLLSMRKSIIPNIEKIQEELRRRVEKD
ncbi:MAG: MFS transporter [Candidatus Helarchaeota archaeon]|nr:MFS transporter [Candidatus Helarchaeota archaeon]